MMYGGEKRRLASHALYNEYDTLKANERRKALRLLRSIFYSNRQQN